MNPGALAGADAAHNARELRRVLVGERLGAHDAHRDALLLGAALALEVTGRVSAPRAGIELAAAAIDEGAGRALLMGLERFGRDEALRAQST
jgi:anthranilate phosphoribosyltransferase